MHGKARAGRSVRLWQANHHAEHAAAPRRYGRGLWHFLVAGEARERSSEIRAHSLLL
jgi:hypothetical protein